MRDWTELKRLAEEATHGDWERDGTEVGPVWDQNASIAKCSKREDAAFIAVANPQGILALIAENERLEALTTLGMSLGGTLRVCGDHRSIMAAQDLLAERDQLRAEVEGLRERAEYWKQRAKSAEGHLFTSDWRAARHALHRHTAMASTPWDELTDAQKTQINSAAGAVIAEVNARRDVRLPHDAAMGKGGRHDG